MRKLTKSKMDKSLFGVCGGVSEFLGIPSFIVRVISILTFPVALWVYLILYYLLTVKEKPTL
ncbi:PspC domain-containing protein [Peribacillus sp. NPDC097295]|uniref:PspC domain-containing protein n=1 Tax=Peribacillus sp. NPDC097295 TaxID=3364402 RepID=UPI0037F350FE